MGKRIKTEYARLCSTVSGRVALAAELLAVVREHGGTLAWPEVGLAGDRLTRLEVSVGPYRCMLDLDGNSRAGAFIGHWYIERDADESVQYSGLFGLAIRGSVNPYHWQKALTCEDTWDGFKRSIGTGLDFLAREMAQQEDRR